MVQWEISKSYAHNEFAFKNKNMKSLHVAIIELMDWQSC